MDVQHPESVGKQIHTPTYIIAHLSERLKFKTLNMPCIGKKAEELYLSYSPFESIK